MRTQPLRSSREQERRAPLGTGGHLDDVLADALLARERRVVGVASQAIDLG